MNVAGLTVPGDKSISHRALMLSALAEGTSVVRGLLASDDVRSTAAVLRALGVDISDVGTGDVRVTGVGVRGLRPPTSPLDCGNSGTTARLMSGILAGHPFASTLVGDASLSRRPMQRIARPLREMGAMVDFERGDGLPMTITGGPLRGVTWRSEVASAQVKSAVLLAALVGGVPVEVHEPSRSRDHTERMLRARGVDVRSEGAAVTLTPGASLSAASVAVPGDPSSATFLVALAALAETGSLEIERVGINPTRTGAFTVLARMGAVVGFEDLADCSGEPTATIVVTPRSLRGTTIEAAEIPTLIDELPVLACVATRAAGETLVRGASELRAKESDRIATVVRNLRAIGAHADETADGFVVHGSAGPLSGRVETQGDHRIAMAFGVLGAVAGNDITIDDRDCVNVSYPGFWADLERVRG